VCLASSRLDPFVPIHTTRLPFIHLVLRPCSTSPAAYHLLRPDTLWSSSCRTISAMAPSSVSTTTKTLRPSELEIPLANVSTNRQDADGPMSPRSWRHRQLTYQPPSRRQTTGSIDAEDYFVSSAHDRNLPKTATRRPRGHRDNFFLSIPLTITGRPS
jgi:hypothetical protein